MHRFQRTTRRFQYGVLSKQNHDSMMGLEGKANIGHPFATGHLQSTTGISRGKVK
jgi:hypothetical protein